MAQAASGCVLEAIHICGNAKDFAQGVSEPAGNGLKQKVDHRGYRDNPQPRSKS